MLEFEDVPSSSTPCSSRRSRAGTTPVRRPVPSSGTSPTSGMPSSSRPSTPRTTTTSRSTGPRVSTEDGRRVLSWPTTRILVATETGFDRGCRPRAGHRAVHAVAGLLHGAARARPAARRDHDRHDRGAPRRRSAHPPDPGHGDGRGRRGYPPLRRGGEPLRGADRDRRCDSAPHRTRRGPPPVSAWAAVPHYAGASPSPKATLSSCGGSSPCSA